MTHKATRALPHLSSSVDESAIAAPRTIGEVGWIIHLFGATPCDTVLLAATACDPLRIVPTVANVGQVPKVPRVTTLDTVWADAAWGCRGGEFKSPRPDHYDTVSIRDLRETCSSLSSAAFG